MCKDCYPNFHTEIGVVVPCIRSDSSARIDASGSAEKRHGGGRGRTG